ncbi:MAG: hypothetical protein BWX81_00627 [Spirochaetes bacterium ADurb.Bin110]|nr:MAG: hypothetical protein BWX81_00627 [Spirochaetes bacterium ADurb.Bin110]
MRIQGELDIAFAYNPQAPHKLESDASEVVVFPVGQGLRGSHDNAFAGVNAQWIDVFHVTNRNTVVRLVSHNLVFDFLPPAEPFFDQHLRRKGKGFFCSCSKLFFVLA